MQFKSRFTPVSASFRYSRYVALFTGVAMAAPLLFQAAPAHADKAKNLKYGAIGLGIVGAYLFAKGKKVPAAAAIAGGYYAYKKSKDVKNDERFGYNPSNGSSDAIYPDSGYTDYNTEYRSEYRSNANVRDRRAEQRAERRGSRPERDDNFDLSPYLR